MFQLLKCSSELLTHIFRSGSFVKLIDIFLEFVVDRAGSWRMFFTYFLSSLHIQIIRSYTKLSIIFEGGYDLTLENSRNAGV